MDRREFLKLCSAMAAGFALFGCRESKVLLDLGGSLSVKDFENEVRAAMAKMKSGFNLVQIPMPAEAKVPHRDENVRFGMAIDLDACDGCGKCILACNIENNIPLVSEEQAKQDHYMHWIEMRGGVPTMCFHCSNAPCEKVCPTGAANHSPDGVSTMVYKRCTGSRFCGANCPVQARKFNYEDASAKGLAKKFNPEVPLRGRGVMEKCSLCLQRIQNSRMDFKAANSENGSIQIWKGRGLQTACAAACPKNAIIFGNWLDENSDLVKEARQRSIFSPSVIANLDPSVVYLKGRR